MKRTQKEKVSELSLIQITERVRKRNERLKSQSRILRLAATQVKLSNHHIF